MTRKHLLLSIIILGVTFICVFFTKTHWKPFKRQITKHTAKWTSKCGWPKRRWRRSISSFNKSSFMIRDEEDEEANLDPIIKAILSPEEALSPDQSKSSVDNIFIDLDKYVPTIDELYNRLTLVTAWSQNHFREGLGFIGTAQQYMPEKKIIVYDLGLNNKSLQEVKSMCNVEVRRFPFEKYPEHYKNLKKFAFKPTIINLVLHEFGVIYYGDASIRFLRSVKELIPDALKHHGFLPHIRCFNPKIPRGKPKGCKHDHTLTVKEVYPILEVSERVYYNAGFTAPAISGGIMLIVNNSVLYTKIMIPWLECALNEACIAPEGADLGNHRFDQSALTLLFFKHMRGEWTPDNDPTPHHMEVSNICRDTNGYDWNPQTC